MRIDSPQVVVDGEYVSLQANVRFAHRTIAFPERLWFRYPGRFESLLYRGVEPFIVALSSLASFLREPIDVEGPVSGRLHAGLDEYWTIYNRWYPQRFSPLVLNCDGYAADAVAGQACGAAFSGGVDSFFTLFRHTDGREVHPTHLIQYALFVHGFDIPLADERTYAVAAAAYEDALATRGVQLVRVVTNLRQFVDPTNWENSHGSALCGTALTLAAGLRRFFVPSSKSYTTLEPWGSDPMIDPLLSTDQFQVIHDGAAYTRFDKLQAMQDWELIRPLARSCWKKPDGLRNCGRCTNCRQTMMVLAALGVLDKFETFPRITSPRHFLSVAWKTPHERLFVRQSIDYAEANGRAGLAWAGRIAMRASQAKKALRKMGFRLPARPVEVITDPAPGVGVR